MLFVNAGGRGILVCFEHGRGESVLRGGGKMPDYRVYGVNKDGQLAEATQISAVAHKMLDGADVEIWEGARLVARLPHEGSEAPGALTYA
jgi:hypothetical protein